LNDVIQKVRGISHNLHSNILKEFGLNEAIRHFIKKITEGTVIKATTDLDDDYKTQNADDDISMYRIVQELVNNILKYANASECKLSSTLEGNELDLVIFHNGKGLTQEQFEEMRYQKEGLGLKNIQNRIILLKGTIRFDRDNDGYRIRIHVPVKSNPVK
jgi:two-component system NarL family sensor kinase